MRLTSKCAVPCVLDATPGVRAAIKPGEKGAKGLGRGQKTCGGGKRPAEGAMRPVVEVGESDRSERDGGAEEPAGAAGWMSVFT